MSPSFLHEHWQQRYSRSVSPSSLDCSAIARKNRRYETPGAPDLKILQRKNLYYRQYLICLTSLLVQSVKKVVCARARTHTQHGCQP